MGANPYEIAGSLYKAWRADYIAKHGGTKRAFADKVIDAYSECIGGWFGAGSGPPPYRKIVLQLAYILKRFPVSFGEVCHYLDVALRKGRYLKEVLHEDGSLMLLSLGSGPGSEIIALADYLSDNEHRRPRTAGLMCVDRSPWRTGYRKLRQHAIEASNDGFMASFYDMLSPNVGVVATVGSAEMPAQVKRHTKRANLVFARGIVSENKGAREEVIAGFEQLGRHLGVGSTVLLMDRPEEPVVDLTAKCVAALRKGRAPGKIRVVHRESEESGDHLSCWGGYSCPDWLADLFRDRNTPPTFNCNCCGWVVELP